MDILEALNLFLVLVVVITNVILSYVVYRNDRNSTTNKVFAALSLVTSIWLIVMFLSLKMDVGIGDPLLWIRLSLFFAIPQSMGVFVLSRTIPERKLGMGKISFLILLFTGLSLMVLTLSPFVFSGITNGDSVPTPIVGPAMPVFGIFVVGLSVCAIITLIIKTRSAEGKIRKQLKYVNIGILLMLGLIIATILVPVAVFHSNELVVFFPLYPLIFLGMTAYAIVRHNLFNIKVIATEAITFILWIILFAKIFLTNSESELILELVVFLCVVVFGVFLIKSVRTEVKQRKRLEELTEKLEDLDKKKDEFLSVAAHELRSPMTAIKGYLSMILEGDAGKIPAKAKEYLDEALVGNDRLVRLVTNMLNVSRIEEGRLTYSMGKINLAKVIKTVFEEYRNGAVEKKLGYKLHIATNIQDKVYVDVDRIHEVVSNLISNAIKYTDEGEVIVNVLNKEGSIYVEVVDTGRGLSEDEQQKLFNKFYRAESNIGKEIGTGLGLYISKLLVEKFGGKIGVFSKKDKGSTFWFELPLVK